MINSSTQEKVQLSETKQQSRLRHNVDLATAGVVLGASVAVGAFVIAPINIHDNRRGEIKAERAVSADEAAVKQQKALITADQAAVTSFILQHPVVCQKAIRSFIYNGPNRKVSDANANAVVGQSGVCPADGFSAVSDTRARIQTVESAQYYLVNDTEAQLSTDKETADGSGDHPLSSTLELSIFGGAVLAAFGAVAADYIMSKRFESQE